MYFGSVKFFKHLIIGTVALLIIIPCIFCVVLGIENSKKDERIAELSSNPQAAVGQTPEEMFELYKDSLKNKEEFLGLVYEYDSELFEQVKSSRPQDTDSNASLPANTITAVPVNDDDAVAANATFEIEDDTDDDIEDDSDNAPLDDGMAHAYRDMLPELYASGTKDVVYDMDMDCVYLTFDDGPSKYTENILYYLDKYNIKATFFVVPDGSEQCAERLRKIVEAGHAIGIHSASHVYEDIYSSVESYLDDFALAYDRVYEATGIKCSLFRFPGGSINDYNAGVRDEIIAEMTRRGFVYFDWNVDSSDAMGATWTEMYNNVLTQTADKNRAVILMHDYNGGYSTVLVLEDIIKALVSDSRNYKLTKLTETVKPVQF